jgi:hypothetical protein
MGQRCGALLVCVLLASGPVAAGSPETAASLCNRVGNDVSQNFERLIEPVSATAGPVAGALVCRWSLDGLDVRFETSLLPSVLAARELVTDALTGADGIVPRAKGLAGIGDAAALRNQLDVGTPGTLDILAVRGNRRFQFVVRVAKEAVAPYRILGASLNVMAKQVSTLFRN